MDRLLKAAAIGVFVVVATWGYFKTDERGIGTVDKVGVIRAGNTPLYLVEMTDGRVYSFLLGAIDAAKIRHGDRVMFRYRGYEVRLGPVLLIPPQIYFLQVEPGVGENKGK